MANKAQRPPAPYVEGEDYVWHEVFQAYVSYDENGVLGYWDAGADDWVDYPAVGGIEGESEEMREAARVAQAGGAAKSAPLPPYFWDEARDGKYPASWDTRRYGEYPAIVDKEGYIVRADHAKAAAIRAAVDKVNPLPVGEEQGRIVEGDGVFAPKGTYWNVSPTGTISEWKPSVSPVSTPLPEGQDRVISEGGYDWAYDPATGDYTDLIGRTPEKPKRTADQMILDLYDEGRFDDAFALDAFLDQIERPRGLTPEQVAEKIMGLAVAPDEAREWIDALTDDWNAVRGTEERVTSPGKALFPTAEEKALFRAQAPAALGAGLPAGLGQGAQGLQFPAFLTTPDGVPSVEEIQAKIRERESRIAQKRALGMPIDDELQALAGLRAQLQSLSPQQPAEPPAFGLTPAQRASLGPEMMSEAQKMQSLGLEEYIRQQNAQEQATTPAWTAPPWKTTPSGTLSPDEVAAILAGTYEPPPLPGEEEEVPPWKTTPPGTLTPEQVAAIKGIPQGSMPFTTSITPEQLAEMPEPFDPVEATKKAAGLPYSVKDRYTGGRGYLFQPTAGFKTRAVEEAEFARAAPAPAGQTNAPLFPTRATTPTARLGAGSNPQFRAQQTAAWKSGQQAVFERGLFGLEKPLSAQDVLDQAWYRQWGQKRQAAFQARPIQRTAFR